jgi:ABC-2 type transport system permease protein
MTTETIAGVRSYQRLALGSSLTKAIADRLLLASVVGLAGAGMGFVMGFTYLALEDVLADMLAQMPEEIMSIAGGVDMATPAGYYTGEMYSIVFPFAVMFVAAASAARAFGGEIENRTIGLVMSTPTRRTRLAVDKAMAMVVHVLLAVGLLSLGVWAGVALTGIDIGAGDILAIGLMMALLSVAVGGLSMLVSIVTGRGVLAILVGMLIAVVAYAWSSFVPLAEPIKDLVWLSPWHHFIGTDPMSAGVDLASAAWLMVLAIAPLVGGVALFKRRDIPA